ncbi:cytochrome P450 [Mycobacterium sherrisii]|uniref:cytochrome P450 n=1 Tax=Mycobacterium sherrisii TaxID=243061 RepID=UPI000A15BEE4|nr:cytochrome P450 [Mycobacterium sherrisii]MCV7032064.1 cytochrome P450 [Mycobacterium sherrisii]ORW76681.1 cytochrome [Mycobacterium sherrisii]
MTDIATDAATEIPDFPMTRDPACPFAPPPDSLALNTSRQLSRVRIWDGSTPWLIHGYEAIRTLFTDSRTSVDDRLPGYPHWNKGMLATVHKRPRSVFTSDAEEHTRYRRMLSKPFTFRRVEGLRPAVQKIADERIDALLAGPKPGDVVGTLALPVPSLVISELLGVPYEDADFFQEQAQRGTGRYATEEDTAHGAASLAKYIAKLIRARMENPAEDLVSDLAERVNAEELSVREATQLALGVLIAGHETTANMISLSIAALLEHQDQRQLLCQTKDPKVIATAIEELMRYLSIIQTGQRRIAVEDIEVGGETIRAGEGIILDVAPANWDARQFPDPGRLDLTRDDGAHVGFGYGRHQCVGQQLARMELQIVLPTLLRRVPTLRLAVPVEDLPFKHDTLAYGVYELPVTW